MIATCANINKYITIMAEINNTNEPIHNKYVDGILYLDLDKIQGGNDSSTRYGILIL